ncbi:Mbeg1-like protein [Raoultibacter phocaeensis]|uniref:Mbeg1-like protein n=1 Tax=Raoultibacter phocaeensis TaxID=2479841 RepID=UPI00111A2D5A|nr:Mbeg1-like protein [Raoultibacter phocaeensis]
MGNIVTYLQDEQRTFFESPFCAVDSLVCSVICYFDFDHGAVAVAPSGRETLLHDIVALSDWKKLCSGSWLEDAKETEDFMRALMASRRYRSMTAAFYANEFSNVVEKQFSALTLFLGQGDAYIAFRGTDGSFAGWKEDFNLCFKHVIPSQRSAEAYLSGVASATECPLIVGGHSKGGNLAEYAALVAPARAYERIKAVYNHDGPSFLDDPSPRIEDASFAAKLNKTVPESSAFGMILERRTGYRVVRSSALSVFQHNPFSWEVECGDFACQEALNKSAVLFDAALDEWLRSKNTEERERFIDTIYDLFVSTDANSWAEFQSQILANTKKIVGKSGELDPDTRRFVLATIASLGGILKRETLKRFRPSPRTWLPFRKERYNTSADTQDPS